MIVFIIVSLNSPGRYPVGCSSFHAGPVFGASMSIPSSCAAR